MHRWFSPIPVLVYSLVASSGILASFLLISESGSSRPFPSLSPIFPPLASEVRGPKVRSSTGVCPSAGADGTLTGTVEHMGGHPSAVTTMAGSERYPAFRLFDHVGGSVRTVVHDATYRYVGQSGALLLYPRSSSRPTSTEPLARYIFAEDIQGLFPVGPRVYVANGAGGVAIVEVRAPTTLHLIGRIPTGDTAVAVKVVGNMAYVATSGAEGGLQLWDIESPKYPRLLGKISGATLATSSALDVVEPWVYVTARFDGGLHVIDATLPHSPTLLTRVDIGTARAIQVAGNIAYVAAESNGLIILDIRDPVRPNMLARLRLPGAAAAVKVVGTLAYVAAESSGFFVVDVSDPKAPHPISNCTIPGGAVDVDIAQDIDGIFAYVAAREQGMHRISVSTPLSPTHQLHYPTLSGIEHLTVRHGVAFVSGGKSGLSLVGVSADMVATELVTTTHIITITNPTTPAIPLTRTEVVTSTVAVTTHLPISATLLAHVSITGTALAAYPIEDRIYVAGGTGGMDILQYPPLTPTTGLSPTLPIRVTRLGHYTTPAAVLDLHVAGALAYLATGQQGVEVVDVRTPSAPKLVHRYATTDAAHSLRVQQQTLYIAGTQNLYIVDVHDPVHPQRRGLLALPASSYVQDVVISGTLAYLADASVPGRLRIVDVANPQKPTLLSSTTLPQPGTALAVTVHGDDAYVAGGMAGVLLFDIHDPHHPTLRAIYDTPGMACGVVVADHLIYSWDYQGGIYRLQRVSVEPYVLYLPLVQR